MRVLIAPLALVLATGCFDPKERDGAVACSESGACPPGFECNPPDNLCYREPPGGLIDAAPFDAALADAAPPDAMLPDAAPPDAAPPPDCSDGLDNDCDGRIDDADPGCTDPADLSEHGTRQCDDGIDNDTDGNTDYHVGTLCGARDTGCAGPGDNSE
jgi:hypothetical protein